MNFTRTKQIIPFYCFSQKNRVGDQERQPIFRTALWKGRFLGVKPLSLENQPFTRKMSFHPFHFFDKKMKSKKYDFLEGSGVTSLFGKAPHEFSSIKNELSRKYSESPSSFLERKSHKKFSFLGNHSKNQKFFVSMNCKATKTKIEADHTDSNSYAAFDFSTDIPNLIDVQRQSFFTFVEHKMKKAFKQPLHFSTPLHDLKILFFPEFLQFQKPEFDQKQAFVQGKTFGSSVYIPIGITSKTSPALRVEWLLVGLLPLMTQQGHFVINGIPRVVLHQIIRNPGIYTIPRDSRTQTATVRIVPEKGGWINLTVDKKNRAWFSTRALRRKVSLLIVLQALGISRAELFERIEHSELLENSYVNDLSTLKKEQDLDTLLLGKTRHDKILIRAHLESHPRTQQEAWRYLYAHFIEYSPYARDEVLTDEKVRDFFWNTLWNKDILVLGKIGRQQFREKLGSTESTTEESLTVEDILRATSALLKLLYKEKLGDEIDSLTQKRIRGCDEFLFEQLLRGIKEFEVFFTRKTNALPAHKVVNAEQNPLDLLWRQNKAVFAKTVSKSWKSFFTSGTLAQFMDQTNPLAETTHKRRLTVLGPGGVNSKQTTIQIRGIHSTFYGRLCPIETPEGQNAGLVNSFTVLSTLSKDFSGNLTTPFYKVYRGQVQKILPPFQVSSRQEYQLIGAPADLQLTRTHLLPQKPLPVRKELQFDYALPCQITAQSVGILQTISVATSLIPFLEHDDANRALMGSNMQRQAVPLINPQGPTVGTGLETRVICDVNHGRQASQSGYLFTVTSKKIKIITPSFFSKTNTLSSFPKTPHSKPISPKKAIPLLPSLQKNIPVQKKAFHPFNKTERFLQGEERGKTRKAMYPRLSKKHSGVQKKNFFSTQLLNIKVFCTSKDWKVSLERQILQKIDSRENYGAVNSYAFFSSQNTLYQQKFTFDLGFEKPKANIFQKTLFLRALRQSFQQKTSKLLIEHRGEKASAKYVLFSLLLAQTNDKSFYLGKKSVFVTRQLQKMKFFARLRSLKRRLQQKNSFLDGVIGDIQENEKSAVIPSLAKNKLSKKVSSFQAQRLELPVDNAKEKDSKTYPLTDYQRTNQSTCIGERPIFSETGWVEKGDLLADGAASSRGKLSIGKNVLVAYVPWEGYNFEDAILISQRLVDEDIFTSLHIDHYDIEVKNTQHGLEKITKAIPLKIDDSTRDIFKIEKLNSQGVVEIGSWVQEGDYLVGKVSPLNPKGPSIERQYEKLYNVIMQREKTNLRNTSLRVPKGVEGFVLDVQNLPPQEPDVAALAEKNALLRVRVVLLQRRRIQVGDKIAGRHGNKGIVSNILPRQDMPYLPDGTPVDIVLNPLGVPSRMNVGQILECLLGLAGHYLQESYTTQLFDEQFGAEASRSLVYSKLYEASVKTSNPWLFEPHHPGKIKLFDGRTGVPFDQPITVGSAYILKLVHLVDDKIHARATGPYSAVTQQPVRGRSRNGGQRLGEMEVWALQAYGAAYTLHELLTLKSDDIEGRKQAVVRIYANKPLSPGRPESFKVLVRELQALCFDLQLYGNQGLSKASTPLALTKLENLL